MIRVSAHVINTRKTVQGRGNKSLDGAHRSALITVKNQLVTVQPVQGTKVGGEATLATFIRRGTWTAKGMETINDLPQRYEMPKMRSNRREQS
jgi:hypothetical protein